MIEETQALIVVNEAETSEAKDYYRNLKSYAPASMDEIGQARVLAEFCGRFVCYIPKDGWYFFDGTKWLEDEYAPLRACEKLTDMQLDEAIRHLEIVNKALEKMPPGDKSFQLFHDLLRHKKSAEAYLKFVKKSRGKSGIFNAVELSKGKLAKRSDTAESNAVQMAFPDGTTVDLRFGLTSRRESVPEDFNFCTTAVSPGDKGKNLWYEALFKLFAGDKAMIDYFQLVVGAGMFGRVYEEVLSLAYAKGSNGKSTIFNSIVEVLGDYGHVTDASIFIKSKSSDTMAWREKAQLKGKRFVLAPEIPEGELNVKVLKSITSSDRVKGAEIYKKSVSFVPTHHVFGYLNDLPNLRNVNEAVKRRLIVIPFPLTITSGESIRNYGYVLLKDAGPAILKWCIEGAKRAFEAGFDLRSNRPESVVNLLDTYMREVDLTLRCIDEVCVKGEDCSVNPMKLYQVCHRYANEMQYGKLDAKEFYPKMAELGYAKENLGTSRKPVTVYKGLDFNMDNPIVVKILAELDKIN